MNFKKFDVYVDENGLFKYAFAYSDDVGVKMLTKEESLNKHIADTAKACGITVDECRHLYVNKKMEETKEKSSNEEKVSGDKFDTEEVKDSDDKASSKDTEEVKDSDEDEDYTVSRPRSRKKHKGIKRLLATVTALAILATGGIHLNKYKNKYNGHNFTPDKPTITAEYSGTPIDNNDYYDEMGNVTGRQDETFGVITDIANGDTEAHTYEEYMQALNDLSMMTNCNMLEISNFINGDSIKGTAYYSTVEGSFYKQSDYEVVKWFSDYRNGVVSSAYKDWSVDGVKTKLSSFYTTYTEFVLMGRPCSFKINGKDTDVFYKDLSPMAQAAVLNISMSMLTINYDYSYESNNGSFIKDDLIYAIQDLYAESLQGIQSKGFNR